MFNKLVYYHPTFSSKSDWFSYYKKDSLYLFDLKQERKLFIDKMIVDYLTKFKTGTREDFERIILDKLPEVLSESQKKTKIKNVLQSLKEQKVIEIESGKSWQLKMSR